MVKLFKEVAIEDKRAKGVLIRLKASEIIDLQMQAQMRNLSTSEYVRRMALHRRADIRIETELILAVRDVVTEIRALHAAYLTQGLSPPEEIIRPILSQCEQAILNVARY